MARKLKAATQKPASSKTSPKNKTTTSDTSASLKRKVDWATIDKNGEFEGFRIEAVRPKTMKQPPKTSNKKQKTNASGASANYKDAPLGADLVQENPFTETELSEVHCKVEPALEWESTNRYRKFTSELCSDCFLLFLFAWNAWLIQCQSVVTSSKWDNMSSSRRATKITTHPTLFSTGSPRCSKSALAIHHMSTCECIGRTDQKTFLKVDNRTMAHANS